MKRKSGIAVVFAAVMMAFIMTLTTASVAFADGEYNLWVGDVQVSSAHTSGPGWGHSGNNESGTLTLNNANATKTTNQNGLTCGI